MVRHTILAKFAIISSLVSLLLYLIITSFVIKPSFIASFIVGDSVVTASCLLLMFKFTDNIYFSFCSKCHERGMKRRVAKAMITSNKRMKSVSAPSANINSKTMTGNTSAEEVEEATLELSTGMPSTDTGGEKL